MPLQVYYIKTNPKDFKLNQMQTVKFDFNILTKSL
jgi:hypothetical protein